MWELFWIPQQAILRMFFSTLLEPLLPIWELIDFVTPLSHLSPYTYIVNVHLPRIDLYFPTHRYTAVNVDLRPIPPPSLYSNFVMLRSTIGLPAPPVTLGGPTKNMIVSQTLGGTKTLKNKSQTA